MARPKRIYEVGLILPKILNGKMEDKVLIVKPAAQGQKLWTFPGVIFKLNELPEFAALEGARTQLGFELEDILAVTSQRYVSETRERGKTVRTPHNKDYFTAFPHGSIKLGTQFQAFSYVSKDHQSEYRLADHDRTALGLYFQLIHDWKRDSFNSHI